MSDLFCFFDQLCLLFTYFQLSSIILGVLLVILLTKWLSTSSILKKHQPPCVPGLPIIGNLHQLGLYAHRSLRSMAKQHGHIFQLHFGKVPVVVVSSAEMASLIMKTHDPIFANRPKSYIFKKILYNCKDVSTAPYGDYWRQARSICVLHLLGQKMVQSFQAVRREETRLLIDKIKHAAATSSPVNLSDMLETLTNDIVCRVALGRKYNSQKDGIKFKQLLLELVELLGCFDIGTYLPWFACVNRLNGLYAKVDRVAKELDNFLNVVVEEHILANKSRNDGNSGSVEEEDKKDFVDILLKIQEENITGIPLDRDSIKAIILDMFSAGSDTTSTTMDWIMTEIVRQPQVLKKLQQEVREIVQNKPEITENDLEKLKYLKAVIKEALRLHAPVPLLMLREATQDVKVLEYDIAAGTQVIVNAWAIGRDPATWEQAEEFIPERFLNTSIDFKGQHFQLIPFGAGRRGCPGIQFAISVIELVLANLVHEFDWAAEATEGGREDIDVAEATGITVRRKHPLILTATPRCC